MAQSTHKDSDASTLESKFRRQWLVLSVLWLAIAIGYLTANWQEIYPKRPYYLMTPSETGENLDTWYSKDEEASVFALKQRLHMPDAEEIRVHENILLVPAGTGAAKRAELIEKARAMRMTLDERYTRTQVYRFAPMVLLFVLGPPLMLLLLGRLAKWAMLRWVGGS